MSSLSTNHLSIDWQASRVDRIQFAGRPYFVKRDDLLTPLSGNKARKLYGLMSQDLSGYRNIVSYGGTQSNAMLALAQFCQMLGISFEYFTRPVPKWLAENPLGNLHHALAHGMHWKISPNGLPPETIASDSLLIPQGIAMPEAHTGLALLAAEIELFCQTQQLDDLAIVTPSGTGTTALYLQQYLNHPVYTVPCVGDRQALQTMFEAALPNAARYPQILDTEKRYRFGEPQPELLDMYETLLAETGIEFELMYDAKTWLVLKDHLFEQAVLYLHNGGISGNESMLARYRRQANLTPPNP
ncbi:MAG: 1-aminocyclopropane-1-carboxylate deaminase [Proteobacteria bacterium]|nr:MAG: 1-aminocyclopropane-1-carboxylate deaminase [Pseudomonadota bacterium]